LSQSNGSDQILQWWGPLGQRRSLIFEVLLAASPGTAESKDSNSLLIGSGPVRLEFHYLATLLATFLQATDKEL